MSLWRKRQVVEGNNDVLSVGEMLKRYEDALVKIASNPKEGEAIAKEALKVRTIRLI
jgi:hypothetical protein